MNLDAFSRKLKDFRQLEEVAKSEGIDKFSVEILRNMMGNKKPQVIT